MKSTRPEIDVSSGAERGRRPRGVVRLDQHISPEHPALSSKTGRGRIPQLEYELAEKGRVGEKRGELAEKGRDMPEISAALVRVPICRMRSRDQVIAASATMAARVASGSKFT